LSSGQKLHINSSYWFVLFLFKDIILHVAPPIVTFQFNLLLSNRIKLFPNIDILLHIDEDYWFWIILGVLSFEKLNYYSPSATTCTLNIIIISKLLYED